MKKSTRNLMLFIIIILFIVCLFSFNVNGVKSIFNKSNMDRLFIEASEGDMMYDYAVGETSASFKTKSAEEVMYTNDSIAFGTSGNGNNEAGFTDERKIIKNVNIDCETQNFDLTYDLIEKKVKDYDGIIDSENFSNNKFNSKIKRNCYFNIRIPKDYTDSFIGDISKNVNILNKFESIEDVTDNYYDVVARLENNKLEEEKLQELLKKAKKLEDVIAIEDKLHSIRSEIESMERRIKNLDKRIDYSTINIALSEVVVYTRPDDVKPTKDSLMAAFKKNFEDTKRFMINTGYYLFTHIPAICLLLSVLLVLLIMLMLFLSIVDGKEKVEKKNKVVTKEYLYETNDTPVIKEEDIETERKTKKSKAKKDKKDEIFSSDTISQVDDKKDDDYKVASLDFTSTK